MNMGKFIFEIHKICATELRNFQARWFCNIIFNLELKENYIFEMKMSDKILWKHM